MWLALAVFCMVLEGVFTALEVATNAASRTRLRAMAAEFESENAPPESAIEYSKSRKTPQNRAAQLLELLENPRRLALMFLTVTSLTMWTAATSIVWHAARVGWDLGVQIVVLALILFCAEVLPLLIAARHPERVAVRGVRWICSAQRVLEPLISLLKSAGKLGAWGLGAPRETTVGVTPDELRTALATAEEEGVLESDERALLEGAMDFREKQVREVMTPHAEIRAVRDDATLREALENAMSESHSRLPVTDENGEIVGIIAAKDLISYADEIFAAPESAPIHRVRDLMRAPLQVFGTSEVATVLEELRRQRSLMAIVADADGQAIGLVTLEDLLEEIVGEIQDEYDDEAPLMVREQDVDTQKFTPQNNASANDIAPDDNSAIAVLANDISTEDKANNSDFALESSTRNAEPHSILCEADVKVREVQRFWRENFGENLRLQIGEESAPSSLSLRDFATQLLRPIPIGTAPVLVETPTLSTEKLASATENSLETSESTIEKVEISSENVAIICGEHAIAGSILPMVHSTNDVEMENENPSASATAKNVISEITSSVLHLEVVEMDGERIEKVRLCVV